MGFHKKIVAVVTLFFAGISGIILISGAGVPALRVMVFLIFCISALNLSVYWREFGRWLNKTAHTAGGHLAEARRKGQQGKEKGKASPRVKEKKAVDKPRHKKQEEPAQNFDDDNDDDFSDEDFEAEEDFEFEEDEE